LLFKYLGLPVGENMSSVVTWDPVLEQLSKYMCLGGRIVLLNSMLNSIPIFYLSILKMPEKVGRKITCIQRVFLWGCVRGGMKINWVKWRKVCQPKEKMGVLGCWM